MTEKIFMESYWRNRLDAAQQEHHAIYLCPAEEWRRIEDRHREIIKGFISDTDSVLDAGCGWGRLLTLMPPTWKGPYLGVDLSPDFIREAKRKNPSRSSQFEIGDLRRVSSIARVRYDWAVLISIKQMVKRNEGSGAWNRIENELRSVVDRILILEYDETDTGEVL